MLITNAADLLPVVAFCLAPVAFVTFETVAILARTDHLAAAWLAIAVVFLAGVAIARTARRTARPRHCRHRSSAVRRIDRRAAIILPAAGVALATLMAGIAVRPVLLGLLGVAVLLILVPGLGALAGHELLALRRASRRTGA